MIHHARRFFGIVFIHILAISSVAEAQDALSQAVLQLSSSIDGSHRRVNGRLYGGAVVATISDRDGDPTNFSENDRITFAIGPRGRPSTLHFTGPRSTTWDAQGFEEWATQNADALLAILFPASLASSVLGRGAGELQAQEVLLATAFATESVRSMSQGGRANAGGMIEYESLRREGHLAGDSAWAWQGLYNLTKTVSLQGRFVQQHEGFTTHATTISADYHPFIEIDRAVRLRIGGTARGGILYSRSNAMDLGSLEFGGGGWVSVFKDLGRVRIGGGTMVHGSRSYLPPIFDGENDGLGFLAEAINARGIQYDVAYGGTAGVDTSSRTTVIVKMLENRALSSREERPDSRLFLAGLSYRFGLPSVNFGYKHYSTVGLRGHALFVQGNFNW